MNNKQYRSLLESIMSVGIDESVDDYNPEHERGEDFEDYWDSTVYGERGALLTDGIRTLGKAAVFHGPNTRHFHKAMEVLTHNPLRLFSGGPKAASERMSSKLALVDELRAGGPHIVKHIQGELDKHINYARSLDITDPKHQEEFDRHPMREKMMALQIKSIGELQHLHAALGMK